jgi:hypothetical protein
LLVAFGDVVEDAIKYYAVVVADEASYGCLPLEGIKELHIATYFQSQNQERMPLHGAVSYCL